MRRYIVAVMATFFMILWGLPPVSISASAQSNPPIDISRPPPKPPNLPPPITPPSLTASTNALAVTNASGTALANYPLQFGRPFLAGVIANAPQVLINGIAVTTQADVKNRYPDGSVEYAVIAVVIPSIPANGSLSLTFQNQTAPNNTPLSQAQMLDPAYSFDATMTLTGTNGAVQQVAARTMLANGDYKVWTAGPVAQTIMLGDDSTARKYDIGFGDGHYPFRPRFFATFWPATHQVLVRFVGENGLTTELEDLGYSLALSLGTAATPVYSLDLTGAGGKLHWSLTTWTRSFWLGGTPSPQVNIDNNLAYLAASRFVANYDTSVALSQNTIGSAYQSFVTHPNGPYDGQWDNSYLWTQDMGNVAARAEIGPYPSWYVWWLYSGDWRMRQLALTAADDAGSFPANLRESDPTRRLSRADPTGLSPATGLGHTVSITDRKTLITRVFNYDGTAPSDAVSFVGPFTQSLWTFDGAHQPSAYYIPYLLTGDPWYLQEMYLWAGFSAGRYVNSGEPDARGPTGDEGGIVDELRGAGWVLRNRAETAFLAPDSDPEKAYFTYLTNDALARWEGGFRVAGTPYDGSPEKVWGQQQGDAYSNNGGYYAAQPPFLHNWEANGDPLFDNSEVASQIAAGVMQGGNVGNYTCQWMQAYVQYALGRVAELGFAAGPLQLWSGAYPIGAITTNPAVAGVLIDAYETPVEASAQNGANPLGNNPAGGYFDWQSLVTKGFTANWINVAGPVAFIDGITGNPEAYPFYQFGGIAQLIDAGAPGAAQAWAWLQANVRPSAPFATDPKWDIVPRTDHNALPAQPTAVPPS